MYEDNTPRNFVAMRDHIAAADVVHVPAANSDVDVKNIVTDSPIDRYSVYS
jgi:hypothetical protein